MSDRRAIPQLPSTDGISDPHVRAFCDALRNGWAVRNGGGREGERFIRAEELSDAASAAVADTLSGAASMSVMSMQAGSPSSASIYARVAQAVSDLVMRSEALELLRTPIRPIVPPIDSLQLLQDRIDKEVSDRIAAIAAEAAARGSGISSEQAARISGDSVLQTQVDTIIATGTADVATILAALQSEQTARIAADNAEAADRTTLAAQMRGAYTGTDPALLSSGLLYTERQARVSAVNAVVSDVTALTARVGDAEASILGEQSARVSADTSLASSLSSLSTSLGVASANIASEATTRSNKDNSLAQAINTIWASIGGSAALIQDGALAAVSPAAVSATKWQQVTAAVTDPNTGQVNGASIKAELNAYASAANTTMNATWSVKSNVNGVITGLALMTSAGAGSPPGTATSHFLVMADRLSLVAPWNTSIKAVPFSVDSGGNGVFSGTIYAAAGVFGGALNAATGTFSGALSAATGTFAGSLTAQVVNTGNIVGAAMSTAYGASSAGASTSVTVSVPAGARSIIAIATLGAAYAREGNGATAIYHTIPANGSISSPIGTSLAHTGSTLLVVSDPPEGTFTFTVSRSYTPPFNFTFMQWLGNVSIAILLTKR